MHRDQLRYSRQPERPGKPGGFKDLALPLLALVLAMLVSTTFNVAGTAGRSSMTLIAGGSLGVAELLCLPEPDGLHGEYRMEAERAREELRNELRVIREDLARELQMLAAELDGLILSPHPIWVVLRPIACC